MLDEIIYPFLSYWACDNLSMLGWKLNRVSKRGHWYVIPDNTAIIQWAGCHSPEVPCAPLAASAELTSMRALTPGPESMESARLLAAGAGRRVSPQCFGGQWHGTHFMCLIGHWPRCWWNQTKIFISVNSDNFYYENNDNDSNSILMIMPVW